MDGVAVPGKLKLKKGSGVSKKKPKSTSAKDLQKKVATAAETGDTLTAEFSQQIDKNAKAPTKTKAELAFEKRQAELMAERVFKKAQKSHREKVEQFNQQLGAQSEFNDIPKVSWTK